MQLRAAAGTFPDIEFCVFALSIREVNNSSLYFSRLCALLNQRYPGVPSGLTPPLLLLLPSLRPHASAFHFFHFTRPTLT